MATALLLSKRYIFLTPLDPTIPPLLARLSEARTMPSLHFKPTVVVTDYTFRIMGVIASIIDQVQMYRVTSFRSAVLTADAAVECVHYLPVEPEGQLPRPHLLPQG